MLKNRKGKMIPFQRRCSNLIAVERRGCGESRSIQGVEDHLCELSRQREALRVAAVVATMLKNRKGKMIPFKGAEVIAVERRGCGESSPQHTRS
jgi:hypothetical protein